MNYKEQEIRQILNQVKFHLGEDEDPVPFAPYLREQVVQKLELPCCHLGNMIKCDSLLI